jgi:hypothetical protein
MGDLFLRIRVEALERNLRDVRELVNVVGTRSDSIRRLQTLLVSPAASATVDLRRARSAIEQIEGLQRYPDIADVFSKYGLLTQLSAATASLAGLEKALEEAKTETRKLLANVSETDALLNRDHVRTIFNAGPARDLLGKAIRLSNEIKAGNNGSAGGRAPTWERYRELVGGEDQLSLFQEYVDVAAGLSLRGMGMDEHFCAMADWLSDYWTTVVDLPYMFAIPARTEASTIPSIIRLGFPEWTIWALPLFAHEFGRILVEKDDELQLLAESLAAAADPGGTKESAAAEASADLEAREARIRAYLADVFATYVMGPAYACACLLLKLDPLAAGQRPAEQASDLVRAEVVLKTLEHMAPAFQPHLGATIKQLRDSWSDALTQLDVPEVAESEERLVEPVVNRLVAALEVIEARNSTFIKFTDADFGDAKRRARDFFPDPSAALGGAGNGPEPGKTEPMLDLEAVTMTQVLNAAWYRRLERPELAAEIAECVRDHIWPRLKPPTRGGESAANTPPSGDIRP